MHKRGASCEAYGLADHFDGSIKSEGSHGKTKDSERCGVFMRAGCLAGDRAYAMRAVALSALRLLLLVIEARARHTLLVGYNTEHTRLLGEGAKYAKKVVGDSPIKKKVEKE